MLFWLNQDFKGLRIMDWRCHRPVMALDTMKMLILRYPMILRLPHSVWRTHQFKDFSSIQKFSRLRFFALLDPSFRSKSILSLRIKPYWAAPMTRAFRAVTWTARLDWVPAKVSKLLLILIASFQNDYSECFFASGSLALSSKSNFPSKKPCYDKENLSINLLY